MTDSTRKTEIMVIIKYKNARGWYMRVRAFLFLACSDILLETKDLSDKRAFILYHKSELRIQAMR